MSESYAGYSVYYYGSGGGQGMAGRIVDLGDDAVACTPDIKAGLNGDPKVEGVALSGSNLDLVVTDYVSATNRPVYVYDVVNPGTPPTPEHTITPGWTNVDNLYSLVKLGSYLYAIDYDNARVVEIDPSTYQQTGLSYTLASGFVPSGTVARGQALIVIGSTLFGLFTFCNSSWTTWANSLLVRFTVVPGTGGSISIADTTTEKAYNANIAPNAFAMDVSGSNLYIASIGGAQGSSGTPNSASRLQSIAYGTTMLNGATVTDVMKPTTAGGTYPYEFRDISFNGSTAYVLMGTYNSSWNLAGLLVKTTDFTTFTTVNSFSGGASGYFWTAQYTSDNSRIWFVRGNQILVYDATDDTVDATLTLSADSLISTGELYDNINDFTYVGAYSSTVGKTMRGYRSPLQASRSPRAVALRAITKGRPEATPEEIAQADAIVAKAVKGRK